MVVLFAGLFKYQIGPAAKVTSPAAVMSGFVVPFRAGPLLLFSLSFPTGVVDAG